MHYTGMNYNQLNALHWYELQSAECFTLVQTTISWMCYTGINSNQLNALYWYELQSAECVTRMNYNQLVALHWHELQSAGCTEPHTLVSSVMVPHITLSPLDHISITCCLKSKRFTPIFHSAKLRRRPVPLSVGYRSPHW